ncbi:hypothetical protein [Micromonospora haikouensis]|uniref:hypothetical protein n=1 Tax=Micromonospora haikouensis TaxID=686309 RepID=UPI003D729DB6
MATDENYEVDAFGGRVIGRVFLAVGAVAVRALALLGDVRHLDVGDRDKLTVEVDEHGLAQCGFVTVAADDVVQLLDELFGVG